jgi:hypothetical protein
MEEYNYDDQENYGTAATGMDEEEKAQVMDRAVERFE